MVQARTEIKGIKHDNINKNPKDIKELIKQVIKVNNRIY